MRVDPRRTVERPSLGWLTVVVLLAATFAVIASRPGAPAQVQPTGDVARAERAIDALLDPRSGADPIAHIPADFTARTGHAPARQVAPDGTTRAVHAAGGCSSPWGHENTRWDFSAGCKAHDLGYDLLRYADAKGQPLDPDLRKRLDDQLSADMHGMCEINPRGSGGACHVIASLYTVGLVVNSWHQRWGPPRNEPIGPWTIGLIVIALLVAARAPVLTPRRRPQLRSPQRRLDPTEQVQAGYLDFLRTVALTGIVLAESILALAYWGSAEAGWVWPLTWLLQLVPLFFLAGGHHNLLAWRATLDAGHGYGSYLAGQIGWLLRPVLAFVTAWLVVPLSLELLQAPAGAIAAFGRIVLQPLWLLGLYLLVVAATPVMYWLHRRRPVLTPAALLVAVVTIGLTGQGTIPAHVGGILVALLFAQLAFHYADGTLWRIPRRVLLGIALAGLGGLIAVTTATDHPRLLIAEPTAYASFLPSLVGVLLVGLVQVCLVALPRTAGAHRVATSAAGRAVALLRDAPMTVYLVFLSAMLLLAGVIGAARSAGLPGTGVDWLTQPRTLLALALIGVPTMLAFVLFERKVQAPEPEAVPPHPGPAGPLDAIAAAIGVLYAALGLLGFAVTGITGESTAPVLLGLPLDPFTNLIHLLLGWYLLHCVRIQTTARPWPWLLTAIACVAPMIITMSGPGLAVHGLTMAVALALAVRQGQAALLVRARSRPVPEGTQ